MDAGMASLNEFGVLDEVDEKKVRATGARIIKTGWVATRKSPVRVKARTVVQELNKGSWSTPSRRLQFRSASACC
eukprot:10252107-Heterocapsa_arctica.AAC.1